jgi:hypothetical protein
MHSIIERAAFPATADGVVAEVAGALALVELNPFSGADVYDCDPDAVVTAATAAAAAMAG